MIISWSYHDHIIIISSYHHHIIIISSSYYDHIITCQQLLQGWKCSSSSAHCSWRSSSNSFVSFHQILKCSTFRCFFWNFHTAELSWAICNIIIRQTQRCKKLQMLQIYLCYFFQLVLIFGPFCVIFGPFWKFWVTRV